MTKIRFYGGVTRYILFDGFVKISFIKEKGLNRIIIEK
jgi:hypothetical protein